MQLIDTHVHVNFEVFQADLDALQTAWRAAGVSQLIHACVKPEDFPQMQALADYFGPQELFLAVGLHPLDAHLWRPDSPGEILAYAQSDPRVVALGEMGLDFFKADNQDQQIEVFRSQLELAWHLDKPVIIHCREAAPALRQVLTEFQQNTGAVTGVMHCWGGTPEETQWFLDLGFYVSFSGVVTFKKAEQVQASARLVPPERLLIETDCPFLAPVPQRGKRNEPAYVRHVAEAVARLRGVELAELAQQTTANARRLFRLPEP